MYRDRGRRSGGKTALLTKSKRGPANMLVRSAMVLSSVRAAQEGGSSSFPGVGAGVGDPPVLLPEQSEAAVFQPRDVMAPDRH
jgi:hypothetical protein